MHITIRPTEAAHAVPGPASVLAPVWVAWVAGNALRGVHPVDLVAALADAGVPSIQALTDVDAVLSSPIFAVAERLVALQTTRDQAVELMRAVDPEPVVTCESLTEEAMASHWAAHRPVVLRGAAADWPAAQWTFEKLRERFPFAPLDVLERPDGWWTRPRQCRRMAFGDLVDVALGPPSDRLYADGRTDVLEQAGLGELRGDLGLLPGLVGDGRPRAWIGPAGTITPTHHDQSTAWQVVLVGRKVLHLASPLEQALVQSSFGLFNHVDPRGPPEGDQGEVRWHRIELGPTDAALVPVGWWHHVEAMEPSISVSFSGFRWPNQFPWYLPGGR